MEDKDPKTESGFCPKIMQIRCKPGGLEDEGPKNNQNPPPFLRGVHKNSTLKMRVPSITQSTTLLFLFIDRKVTTLIQSDILYWVWHG